jgi:hypothetical protein
MGHIDIFLILLVSAVAISLLWGGAPERIAAVIITLGVVASALVASPYTNRFQGVEVNIMAVDTVMLLSFVLLALYADRFWPMWISSMQLILVLSHLPKLMMTAILSQSYMVLSAMWAYPIVLMLIIGTIRHRKRLKEFGTDYSWSDFAELRDGSA